MENEKLGKAISFLRKRAGYTQRELSELLDISDKAVSKWERGLNYPDISLLAKLSILLDTDIESLLEGNVSYCNQMWRGVMVFDDYDEVSAVTQVYDKPVVYYILSYFLLVGIKEILILSSLEDNINMERILGDGRQWGIHLTYCIHNFKTGLRKIWNDKKDFISSYNIMVVYGKKLLYGIDITKTFQRAMARRNSITLLTTQSKCGVDSSQIMFDSNKKVIVSDTISEKNVQYAHHTIPILFCSSEKTDQVLFSIDSFKRILENLKCISTLRVEMIGRGILIYNLQNFDDVVEASTFVRNIQKNQNEYISCVEEIAWRRGLISKGELKRLGEKRAGTEYGRYILEICKD